MKNKIWLGLLSLILATGLIVAGCAKPSAAPPAPNSILIGIEIGQTGFDSSTGALCQQGYDLAVTDINQNGGVSVKEFGKKIPLKLVYVDTESDPEKAVAAAEALNSQYNVSVACGTTMISAAPDTFEKDKLPAIACLETVNALQQQGFKYWFHIGMLDSDKADAVLSAFGNLPQNIRPTKYAIFEEQLAFVTEFMGFVRQAAASQGINIVYDSKYATMSPDLTPLIKGAQNAGAEVVLSCPNAGDAITMLKQMSQLGYKPEGFVAVRGADDPAWPKLGPMGDYVVGSPDWHPALNFPGVKEFNAEYTAKFGTDPHPDNGIAYASIQIVANAIERAGSLDRDKIRDAIATTDMMTIAGPVKFDNTGQMINPTPVVIQWQKGVEELVWPDNLKTNPLVYPIP